MADLTPTEAEQKVIDAALTGDTVNFRVGDEKVDEPANGANWGSERTVRATVIWTLCTGSDERWKVHPAGVAVLGARIIGELSFESATLICRLRLALCSFESRLVLRDARARTINLAASHVPEIGADGVNVDGDFFLHNVRRNKFQSNGEIRLLGAEIRGDLDLTGASLSNPNADALSVDRAKIRGNIFLRAGFKADGGIRLVGTEIGGDLDCDSASLSNPKADALSVDGAKIRGNVFLRTGFKAFGEIRLLGAEIGGDLDCSGAELSNPDGNAISADGAEIGGAVFLSHGFKAAGAVRFIGAEIGGQLSCRGATFKNGTRVALNFERTHVAGSLIVDLMPEPPIGTVHFAGASAGSFVDDRASWPAKGQIALNGFNYVTIGGHALTDSRARLDWLRLQPKNPFRPQPYEQLIKVLRSMGHDRDARAVAIAKQEDLRRWGELSHWERAWNWFLGKTIGHGYRPWKALVWGAFVVAFGVMFFKDAERYDVMVPTDARVYLSERWTGSAKDWLPREYPPFNPWLYSLDVFLPIVDFHEKGYWEPRENSAYGAFIKVYSILHIIAGWVLTTLAVAGFSGLVKKD
jgi:hypothetical protein